MTQKQPSKPPGQPGGQPPKPGRPPGRESDPGAFDRVVTNIDGNDADRLDLLIAVSREANGGNKV